MNGLELSKAYYTEIGLPMLEQQFPALLPRLAAGLVGEGSECFGFDDEISRDHDFGPGFCLWLNEEDFAAYGRELQEAYDRLPDSLSHSGTGDGQTRFHGFPLRVESARGSGRVGVHEITTFYARYTGRKTLPQTGLDWLRIPEENLALVTNGAVFRDPAGLFSHWRSALQAYFPEDVRIKKIAARAAEMARTGQYNYGRCMRRGEYVAAEMAIAGFLRSAMSMICLLNRLYTPYYKWMHRMLREHLPELSAGAAVSLLEELSLTESQHSAWTSEIIRAENPYINKADKKVLLTEEICRITADELRKQGLSSCDSLFLEDHTWEIMDKIRDPDLRGLHVLAG